MLWRYRNCIIIITIIIKICETVYMCFQSKKKGLSVEEKRSRMMDFFYEKVS